jgi:hypothetical protein
MKSTDFRGIAELIGVAAIVASLIFVGLQLKQSQEIAIASQYQARAEATMSFFSSHMESEYLIPPARGLVSDSYSENDVSAALWYWTAFDNHYFQYQSGFLSEGAWQGQLRAMKQFWGFCVNRRIYEIRKIAFRSELIDLVESWEGNCREGPP